MSNSIAPGSSVDVNVKVTALTTNPNVPVTYKTIILKKNLVNGVNTLIQEMMSAINTKYIIKYNYMLGENITIPENCILEFDGGSISASGSNDTITGQNTAIQAGLVKIFNTNITLTGTWNVAEAYPEWFGAIGHNADKDDEAIQALINNTSFNLKLLEKLYYIKHTIYIDVQKRWIRGLSGRSIICVTQKTNDDSAVIFHGSGGTNNWDARGSRTQEHGYFQVICNNYCGGIRLGAKAGTSQEGHVDQNNIRCVFVKLANWGLIIGSHVYKCIIDTFINQRNKLCLTYDDNSGNNGECLTFNNCGFWDGGKVYLRYQNIFNECTFHVSIHIKNGHSTFNTCHFERINGEGNSENPTDCIFLSESYGVVEFNGCDCPGSKSAIYVNNLFRATNPRGIISVNGGDWEWFLRSIKISDGYSLCQGNVYLNNIISDYKFDGNGNFISKQLYDKPYIPQIENNIIDNKYDFKVSSSAFTISNLDTGIKITHEDFHQGSIKLTKLYKIPTNKKTFKFIIGGNFVNSHKWIQTDQNSLSFYDYEGNLITKKGHYVQRTNTQASTFIIADYFLIPVDAVYCNISLETYIVGGKSEIDITKWAIEFM